MSTEAVDFVFFYKYCSILELHTMMHESAHIITLGLEY